VRVLVGGQVTELTGSSGSAALDVGTHAIPASELRFGIDRGRGRFEVEAGPPPPTDNDVDDGGLHASVEVDILDASTFPSEGFRVGARWRRRFEELGAEQDYEVARFEALAATTPLLGQTFALRVGGQYELAGDVTFLDAFDIGGLFRLSGLGEASLAGQEGATAALLTYRRLSPDRNPLRFPVYIGASFETGGLWNWSSFHRDDLIFAGSAFLGLDSPIGPIFLALGFAEGGEQAVYFTVGQIRF
jgi:NTE family protein